jgi:hypothetical protein
MKNKLILLIYAIAVTLALTVTANMMREDRISEEKTAYSELLRLQNSQDAPDPLPQAEYKEASFKDKSQAKGEDSAPSVSFG